MSEAIISVENLGKCYQIGNKQEQRYTALRDVIANKAKNIFKARRATSDHTEDFWALKDVNFEIKKGDAVGIIGRNGAGKSTLLKLLSRITEPTTGRITLNGRVASLLEVGTGFHQELTGRENIYLNGSILGMSHKEIKSKFDEIVDFSDVEKFLDTPVKRYSSGMYVRLAFAVAAHLEPEILIVDEVLAVGDAEFQKKCLGKMNDVSKEGRTVLFVSHNIDAVRKLTTSTIYLKNGEISFHGMTNEGIMLYKNDFSNNGNKNYICLGKKNGFVAININTSDAYGIHRFSEPINFTFKINFVSKPINAGLAFQIVDNSGLSIINPVIYDDNIAWSKEGDFEITALLESPKLMPGRYTLTAHLGDKFNNKHIETVEEVCAFEIVNNNDIVNLSENSIYVEDINWTLN
ncbi:ABC transporter ATP-binding protein [Mucilaginibacter sp.]|uniref:ABC transporter ATP-binding protein n=1 Tax=Mucilaginibacter sp. TaxID=1882438 RepID=UPI00262C95C8|nr:ABC transporter ATP-binding protein [Mucilaginibacter sp.]